MVHILSFIKDGKMLQIIRVKTEAYKPEVKKRLAEDAEKQTSTENHLLSAQKTLAVTRPASTIRASMDPGPGRRSLDHATETPTGRLSFRIGGKMRLGCSTRNGRDDYSVEYDKRDGYNNEIALKSSLFHRRCVRMQLFVDGEAIEVSQKTSDQECEPHLPHEEVDKGSTPKDDEDTSTNHMNTSSKHEIALKERSTRTIVATYSLAKDCSTTKTQFVPDLDFSKATEEYVGISEDSHSRTKKLWAACQGQENDKVDFEELDVIGRSIEYALSVSALPILEAKVSEEIAAPSHLETASLNSISPTDLNLQPTPIHPETSCVETIPSAIEFMDGPSQEALNAPLPSSPSSTSLLTTNFPDEATPKSIAFLDNIMINPTIRLDSTLWILRLLIKADTFLGLQKFSRIQPAGQKSKVPGPGFLEAKDATDIEEDSEGEDANDDKLPKLCETYRATLLTYITGSMAWMLKISTDGLSPFPSGHPGDKSCIQVSIDREDISLQHWSNSFFYITISAWYVLHNCPAAAAVLLQRSDLWEKWLNRPEITQRKFTRFTEPVDSVVQWYHYKCLIMVIDRLYKHDSARFRNYYEGQLTQFSKSQARRSRTVVQKLLTARKSKSEPYSLYNEKFDRFCLLSNDLGFDSDTSHLAMAFARQRIVNRERTTVLNPGMASWAASRPETFTAPPVGYYYDLRTACALRADETHPKVGTRFLQSSSCLTIGCTDA